MLKQDHVFLVLTHIRHCVHRNYARLNDNMHPVVGTGLLNEPTINRPVFDSHRWVNMGNASFYLYILACIFCWYLLVQHTENRKLLWCQLWRDWRHRRLSLRQPAVPPVTAKLALRLWYRPLTIHAFLIIHNLFFFYDMIMCSGFV